MSQENVELARRAMESMDAFFSLLDEYIVADVRSYPLPDYSGLVVGRDKFIEMSRHYWGAWDSYRVEAEDFIDAGQSVVITVREQGRGKGSGVRLDRRWAQIWTFRDGRIVRWEPRRSTEDAVKAAGLPAQTTSQGNVEIVRRIYVCLRRAPGGRNCMRNFRAAKAFGCWGAVVVLFDNPRDTDRPPFRVPLGAAQDDLASGSQTACQ
jgi:ketosteroid isomerase-like protein